MTELKKSKVVKSDRFTRTSKFCRYVYKNGEYFVEETTAISKFDKTLREWSKPIETVILKKPEEFGLRSASTWLLFCKDYEDRNSFNSVQKVWFKMFLEYNMRPDTTNNLYFLECDGKILIKDLHYGTCCQVNINQSDIKYTCKNTKPEKVTAEQATELVRTTGTRLIFNRIEQNSDGSMTFGVTI